MADPRRSALSPFPFHPIHTAIPPLRPSRAPHAPQVAAVWGLGVSLAILSTADASGAHLNPAVTLAFLLVRPSAHGMTPTKALLYTVAQLLGGVAGGAVNLAVHGTTIAAFERAHGIVRGSPESVLSAAAFGEYFPNPSLLELSGGPYRAEDVDAFGAMGVEAWGSAVLCFVIFGLTHSRNKALGSGERVGVPLMIGATVAVLLALYAPITQAGWNPARDLGPRLVAAMAGWGAVAIPGPNHGCWAYVVGPCVGAPVGAFLAEVGLWGTWYERLDGPSEKPAAHARPMSELGVDADAHTDGVHVELAAGARTAAAADDGSPPSSPAVLPAPRSRAEPLKPIVLFTTDKPNGKKVSIVLEELGLPYRVLSISLEAGEQHSAAFGRYSPNHKVRHVRPRAAGWRCLPPARGARAPRARAAREPCARLAPLRHALCARRVRADPGDPGPQPHGRAHGPAALALRVGRHPALPRKAVRRRRAHWRPAPSRPVRVSRVALLPGVRTRPDPRTGAPLCRAGGHGRPPAERRAAARADGRDDRRVCVRARALRPRDAPAVLGAQRPARRDGRVRRWRALLGG